MAQYTDYEKKLLALVDEHGWQYTHVFDPEGESPNFGYSVGFASTLNSPEFIIFGLPRKLMNNMLWEIYRQIENGAVPADGMRWSGLLEGFDCISRAATHEDLYSDYVVSADWLWKTRGNEGHPQVFQMVWPGARQGLFPWEDGCSQEVIDAQPSLWKSS